MSGNILVINVDIREIRVALIEQGIIAELHIERLSSRSTLGNVVLGKVSRVLPGMQAAFIDIGEDRAAFLHVEDLIRPDDFEAYLSGARRQNGVPAAIMDEDAAHEPTEAAEAVPAAVCEAGTDQAPDSDAGSKAAPDSAARSGEALDSDAGPSGVPGSNPGSDAATDEAGVDGASGVEDEDKPRGRRRSRRTRTKRSTRKTGGKREPRSTARRRTSGSGGRSDGARKRGRSPANDGSRISKNTPIREVVREGQQVVVQVTKEPIGTKGARVSSHVSLPGRYVVYLPTVDTVGISKRIGSDRERGRLREAIESAKPPTGGLVVRTVAEGLTKKHLKADVGYLVRLWDEIARKRDEAASAPCVLYEELDLVLKTARDLFTEDVARIIIDNREQYGRLRRFVGTFMPDRVGDIELYEGREPVFDAYGIEDEIGRALSRKVPLPSGGHLIIDQAEALTAIDVNTGRFVGKGSKDVEDTILATNLEAVEEIAYQLRFRNIGGLIILDLIDMERAGNRRAVRRKLESLLAHDKAKSTLNRISDLGLIEMTRKRTRESLARLLHEPCFYCDGTGQLMSRETVAYEILRQIRREQSHLRGYQITVNAHPAIIDLLEHVEQDAIQEVERMFARRIQLVAHDTYHIEQFDLQGI